MKLNSNAAFTLLEILVAVLIIGILGAIVVPQYQRAVLKSRYASLMPIAKAMADSNEAYFLEHGIYASNAQDLPVQGRRNYSDGTELEFGTSSDYAYVLATRENNFPNNYIMYQKHSANYPGEIHCEANANDTQAQDVCKSFGPTEDIGETLTTGYVTYVLFGTGDGVTPAESTTSVEPEPVTPVCPDGATCDDGGNITACPSGQTLNNGSCEDCSTAFPNATACSTTSYEATSCSDGYNPIDGVCVEETKTVCLEGTLESGQCIGTDVGTVGRVLKRDGSVKQEAYCYSSYKKKCTNGFVKIYDTTGGYRLQSRQCSSGALTLDGFCFSGKIKGGSDYTYNASAQKTSESTCSTISSDGKCTEYSGMWEWNHDIGGKYRVCTQINGTICNTWSDWL